MISLSTLLCLELEKISFKTSVFYLILYSIYDICCQNIHDKVNVKKSKFYNLNKIFLFSGLLTCITKKNSAQTRKGITNIFLHVKLKWAIQYFSRILCLGAKLEKVALTKHL
jgi:hypothetical protein